MYIEIDVVIVYFALFTERVAYYELAFFKERLWEWINMSGRKSLKNEELAEVYSVVKEMLEEY